MPASTHRRSIPIHKPKRARRTELVTTILDLVATAADIFGDARQLAIALHDENHEQASRARYIATAVATFAHQAHQAAEIAAALAGGEPW